MLEVNNLYDKNNKLREININLLNKLKEQSKINKKKMLSTKNINYILKKQLKEIKILVKRKEEILKREFDINIKLAN
jgi:hypothetical protein